MIDIKPSGYDLAYRETLNKKIAEGVKLSGEEVLWLETHRKFSQLFGYPYLRKDIIDLEADQEYRFHISFVKATHPHMIAPCFFGPEYEGEIITDAELYDFNKKKSKVKAVKKLVAEINADSQEFYFNYRSRYRAICVTFFRETVKYGAHVTENSQDSEGLYMIRKEIAENKIVYRCSVEGKNSAFDSLEFLVGWERH